LFLLRFTGKKHKKKARKQEALAGHRVILRGDIGADLTALQTGLNYADCSTIQPGGKCYKPNDLPPCLLSAARSYPTSARTLTLDMGGREG
jgi:hypothetical protein